MDQIIRADMHYHGDKELNTPAWNAFDIAREIRRRGKLELDALAITEMNYSDRRFEALRKNSSRYEKEGVQIGEDFIFVEPFNLVLFRTQEIATGSYNGKENVIPKGHVLLLGAKRTEQKGLKDVLDFAGEQEAAVIFPHTFGKGHEALMGVGSCISRDHLTALMEDKRVHAFEDSALLRSRGILNTILGTYRLNEKARELALHKVFPIVANSDGHSLREAGSAYTSFDTFCALNVKGGKIAPENYLPFIVKKLREGASTGIYVHTGRSPVFSADEHAFKIMSMVLKDKLGKGLRKYSQVY